MGFLLHGLFNGSFLYAFWKIWGYMGLYSRAGRLYNKNPSVNLLTMSIQGGFQYIRTLIYVETCTPYCEAPVFNIWVGSVSAYVKNRRFIVRSTLSTYIKVRITSYYFKGTFLRNSICTRVRGGGSIMLIIIPTFQYFSLLILPCNLARCASNVRASNDWIIY